MGLKVIKCKRCGSTNIEVQAWVNPNNPPSTNEILKQFETKMKSCFCHSCNLSSQFEIVEE